MNNNRSVISFFCCLLFVLALAGCGEPVSYPEIVSTQPVLRPAPSLILPEYRIVGQSVHKRPILCTVIGNGQDVILILAVIHGNEPAGMPLVHKLSRYLQSNTKLLKGRKVVLMPVANPDGMAFNSRFNANGVDLNRNFASKNRINGGKNGYKALSEPEACAIEKVIREYKPDRIVSIHQPLTCIDYDGPANSLAERMAEHCTLSVRKIGAQPGSLGSYAGIDGGIPLVTFEMKQSDTMLDQDVLWQRYGSALLAAIIYPQNLISR